MSHCECILKIYASSQPACAQEVSPLTIILKNGLYPIPYACRMEAQYNIWKSKTTLDYHKVYEIKFAHAYITRNKTKRMTSLNFYTNEQDQQNTVRQYKLSSTTETMEHASKLTSMEDMIIPCEGLLLTANKTNTLFTAASNSSEQIFVLNA